MTSWAHVGHGKLKAKAPEYINFPSLGLEENLLDLSRGYQFSHQFTDFFCMYVLQIEGFHDRLCKPQECYILMNKLACSSGIDDEDLG